METSVQRLGRRTGNFAEILLCCPVYLLSLFLLSWPAVKEKYFDSCESYLPETFCFGHLLVATILVPLLSVFPI